MGNILSWFETSFYQKKASILMLGLDAAGKTAILTLLKLNHVTETVPTIGFNTETVEYRNVSFCLWDVGGQKKLRELWKHYFNDADAVIFVVDSNDRDRMGEAKGELYRLMSDPQLSQAALLVLCNKQDLPNRMTPSEIVDMFGFFDRVSPDALGPLLVSRKWYVQGCCAHTGDGVFDGLDWLSSHLPDA